MTVRAELGLVFALIGWIGLLPACSSSSKNDTQPTGTGGTSSGGASGAGATSSGGSGNVSNGKGCADGTEDFVFDANMVGCDGEQPQCDAEQLCGVGWHLCPFEEWVEHGGDSTPSDKFRWLRSCVREATDSAASCPSSAACQQCTSTSAGLTDVVWDCGGAVLHSGDVGPIGVMASDSPAPARVGCTEATCAFVNTNLTSDAVGAVCCK
jgi:hypothetical protein